MTQASASPETSLDAALQRLGRDPRDVDAAAVVFTAQPTSEDAARTVALFGADTVEMTRDARRSLASRMTAPDASRALLRRAGVQQPEHENAPPHSETPLDLAPSEPPVAEAASAAADSGRTTITLGAPQPPDPDEEDVDEAAPPEPASVAPVAVRSAAASGAARSEEEPGRSLDDVDTEVLASVPEMPTDAYMAAPPPVQGVDSLNELRTRLAVDPTDLDALEKLSGHLAHHSAWAELATLYEDLLEHLSALSERNLRLEGVLWRKLAGLQQEHLSAHDDAVASYRHALDLHASRETARSFSAVLGDDDGALDDSWRCQACAPFDAGVVSHLARALTTNNRLAAASAAHGVAALLSGAEPPESSVELGCATWSTAMGPDAYRLVRPESRDIALDRLFSACREAFGDLYAHTMADYELDERNRLPHDDPLAVSVLVRELAMRYGLSELPALYVYRNVTGFAYAFFETPTFIVGRDLLQGFDRRSMRLRIAQLMTWTQPYAFLPALLSLTQLSQLVAAVCDWVAPAARIVVTEETQRVRRRLQQLTPETSERLEAAVRGLSSRPDDDALERWRALLGFEAARTGALFVGDPAVAVRAVREHAPIRGIASEETWERETLAWMGSRAYADALVQLGADEAESGTL